MKLEFHYTYLFIAISFIITGYLTARPRTRTGVVYSIRVLGAESRGAGQRQKSQADSG